ncbi:hypothetical protein SUGI_0976200 [Cryptomeria japonica]|nr:hypothetical protein SUGI_0976200 [Cryptomeria japonica]
MELDDYELNLQTEIVYWKEARNIECLMEFIRKPRNMKLGMRGLVWSIQALALQTPSEYSFNIMDVKRSETPLSLSEAAAPNLPEKFELLLVGYKASMESVCRVQEALDKLYAFSHLFSLAQKDGRWWIVVDAKIIARTCECAKEALYQAAEATAAILVDQYKSPIIIEGQQSESCGRSGWWIDKWRVADELWATGFFPRDSWKYMMRLIQADAVEKGNVVQWCTVRIFDEPNPNFQFEVAVNEFLDGDDVLLRIGLANDRTLMVRVFLTEAVEVICSQEGLETRTSLGLAYLLPDVVKDYIRSALRQNQDEVGKMNVVQGLLQHLIRYLAFLGQICVICGNKRPLYVPWSSICSNICKARKQRYKDAIAAFLPDLKISEDARLTRREQYVRNLYTNSKEGHTELGILLNANVVEEEKTRDYKDDDADAIDYEKAVGRVTKMVSIKL